MRRRRDSTQQLAEAYRALAALVDLPLRVRGAQEELARALEVIDRELAIRRTLAARPNDFSDDEPSTDVRF